MTRRIPVAEQKPSGPGRKRLPDGERKVKTSISLHPETMEFLLDKGAGVLSQGIELVVAEARARLRRRSTRA